MARETPVPAAMTSVRIFNIDYSFPIKVHPAHCEVATELSVRASDSYKKKMKIVTDVIAAATRRRKFHKK